MARNYDNDYPSVTTVLNVLRKIGLEFWFKNNTREFCDAESKKGKEVGTLIHAAIQAQIENETIKFETLHSEEVRNALKSFALFRTEHPEIKLKKAEIKVTSEKYRYNGTLDCLAQEGKNLMLFDWKTGTCKVGQKNEKDKPPIYDEHEYQVSAYVKAYNEQEKADIQQARILVLAKDKIAYNYLMLFENVIDDHFENVFLPALKICDYQKKNKKGGY